MPIEWKNGMNPYRFNPFTILSAGLRTTKVQIIEKRDNLTASIRFSPNSVQVSGKSITDGDVTKASSILLDNYHRAEEILLVHPLPECNAASFELDDIIEALNMELTIGLKPRSNPNLKKIENLASQIPALLPEDILWPEWKEFDSFSPLADNDNVQFDM